MPFAVTYLVDDGVLIVFLDLHQHVCPRPVLVVVLQRGHGHYLILEVLVAPILTLTGRGGDERKGV